MRSGSRRETSAPCQRQRVASEYVHEFPFRLARIDEAKRFLDAHPEIEAFDIVLTDANGVGRGKIIRRHELLGIYESGRHLPISILGLDITGEDVHETGLIWDSGDGDLRGWPIPGTLVPLHGTQPGARPGADVDVPSRRRSR